MDIAINKRLIPKVKQMEYQKYYHTYISESIINIMHDGVKPENYQSNFIAFRKALYTIKLNVNI